jgi:rhodanese-related sulfurtransferase
MADRGSSGGLPMRLILSFFVVSLLAALAQSGCNSAEQRNKSTGPVAVASPAAPAAADGARRVTVAELKDFLAKNQAVVIDVRNEASYNAGHITGAKLIPEAEILNRMDELPKNKLIVTYCSWPAEHTSARAVVDLKAKGVENAAALLGGFAAWQNAGYPVESKVTKQP